MIGLLKMTAELLKSYLESVVPRLTYSNPRPPNKFLSKYLHAHFFVIDMKNLHLHLIGFHLSPWGSQSLESLKRCKFD